MRLYLALFGFAAAVTVRAESAPTYTGEVQAILQRHCAGCHTRGGVGRVALDTYEQASAFSREIENTANNRQMPPLFAVPGFGEFRNEDPLSPQEIQTVIRWVDSGSPRGGAVEKRASPVVPAWRLGQPDLLVKTPQTLISGSTGFETKCFVLPVNLATTRGVRVIDVQPGDRRVVYQVRIFVADQSGCQPSTEKGRTLLGQWAPGVAPDVLPPDLGRALTARSAVLAEITYQKIGLPVTDATRIGIYFQPAKRYVETLSVANDDFSVPVGDWNYSVEASKVLDREVALLSIFPSMRRLGMEMRIVAVFPGGATETLLWVRDYDSNRQQAYELKTPKRLPAGTLLKLTALFNNSDSNAKLPRGKQEVVRAGTAATDEQMAAFFEYVDGTL